ncbi:hypothetical protein CEXT_216151 [Caerostris extrusa]|uniref:Uncharacterized protein n=1 Tax=Caerostris extrusa TaxID=172846 RepID=A0AAV4XV55_CAEEX|nr:hypothetical protein CEXT_216151 [Caerostris extrusa]
MPGFGAKVSSAGGRWLLPPCFSGATVGSRWVGNWRIRYLPSLLPSFYPVNQVILTPDRCCIVICSKINLDVEDCKGAYAVLWKPSIENTTYIRRLDAGCDTTSLEKSSAVGFGKKWDNKCCMEKNKEKKKK